jgi:hypothetical protein
MAAIGQKSEFSDEMLNVPFQHTRPSLRNSGSAG